MRHKNPKVPKDAFQEQKYQKISKIDIFGSFDKSPAFVDWHFRAFCYAESKTFKFDGFL